MDMYNENPVGGNVDAGNVEVVSPETTETVETVNADSSEVTNGEQGEVAEGSQQDEGAHDGDAAEPHQQSKEENAQFAKVRREAEARARAEFEQRQAERDAECARLAQQYGWTDVDGNPIQTEESYWRALKAQAQISALVEQGNDAETARAIVERDELRARLAEIERTTQEQARLASQNAEFFDFYKEVNGREFSSSDEIPDEVFRISQEKQIPLKYAYAEYIAKGKVEQKRNIETGKKTAEANLANAASSTGSVTGSPQSDVLTESEINAHANDIAWMNKNFKRVEEFYQKKKG